MAHRRTEYTSSGDGMGLMYMWVTVGPKKRLIAVKRPSIDEIQRHALAKYFMRISQPYVYLARNNDPTFQTRVEKWKKSSMNQRANGNLGSRLLPIRRSRGNDDSYSNQKQLGDGEYDFDGALKFIGFCPNWIEKLKEEETLFQGIEDTELWQRRHWKTQYNKDITSDKVCEIMAMERMVSQSAAATCPQPFFTICLETSRYSLKNHKWVDVSRALRAMVQMIVGVLQLRRNWIFPPGPTIVWTVGFLTIVNSRKDDVDAVIDFMRKAQLIFKTFPPWWGVQIAVWLIQKGYVLEAQKLLEENSLENMPRNKGKLQQLTPNANPKKEMSHLLSSLFKAVFLYCAWKLEDMNAQDDEEDYYTSSESRHALKRKGEAALKAYQTVYEMWQILHSEPMCFLPPFTELLVEFGYVERARDIIQEIYNQNDGNMFVEQFYTQFLEQNADDSGMSTDEIARIRARLNGKFTFSSPSRKVYSKGKRQIKALKESRKKAGEVVKFKQLPNPGFSW